jgi:hypothetical protein
VPLPLQPSRDRRGSRRARRRELARTVEDSLEPDEVEDFVDHLREALARSRADEDCVDRVRSLVKRLERLVEAEAGLTDRYADDVDPMTHVRRRRRCR